MWWAAKEKIVGFYSTGPKIRPADIDIDALFRRYHPHPALVIIDIRPDVEGIPVQAYVTQEAVMEVRHSIVVVVCNTVQSLLWHNLNLVPFPPALVLGCQAGLE